MAEQRTTPDNLQRAIELSEAHWKSTAPGATQEDIEDFQKKLYSDPAPESVSERIAQIKHDTGIEGSTHDNSAIKGAVAIYSANREKQN